MRTLRGRAISSKLCDVGDQASSFSLCKYNISSTVEFPSSRSAKISFPLKKKIPRSEGIRLRAFGEIFAATLNYLERSAARGCHVRSRSGRADDKIEWDSIHVRRESSRKYTQRTCRHRRPYIEIPAKETKRTARETIRETMISREATVTAPARSLSVFVSRRRARFRK